MVLYKTVACRARAEQTIERSRFIVTIAPVSSKEEADGFIKEVSGEFKDASHNVPAMVVGDKMQIQWASDNGEPQGTSGAPIVQMLVKEGVTNTAVVVTRYFGGIKLGTGGLVRAYTGTAKLGLEKAGIKEVREMLEVKAQMDYTYLAKLQKLSEEMGFELRDIEYTDKVTASAVTAAENAGMLRGLLEDLTSGTVEIISETVKTS
ncbi:MAG: YigZ family protein [Eubacteriaceae bacterium]|jgi:uncharacterized YigZ family protein|nr:YigZ family protein [Eubacteriaceae bacterium]